MKRVHIVVPIAKRVKILKKFYASGLSMRQFSLINKVSYSTLNSWKKHKKINELIKKDGADTTTNAIAKKVTPKFEHAEIPVDSTKPTAFRNQKFEKANNSNVIPSHIDVDTNAVKAIKLLSAENLYYKTLLEVHDIEVAI